MSSSLPLRIGVVGASNIAVRTIITPAQKRDDVVVQAVAARDSARAAAYAEKHGIANVAASYAELFARDDIDLVYIGLPPVEHAKVSIAALQAGKAVLCEKVFAMNADEAISMVGAATAAGRPLIEAMLQRFHPLVTRAIDLVQGGALGTIQSARASGKAPIAKVEGGIGWSPKLGGGALLELGCFPVHLLRSVLATEPQVINASAVEEEGVDVSVEATLRFGDAIAEISTAINSAPNVNLVVEGSRGKLEITNYLLPAMGYRFRVTTDELSIDEMDPVPSPYDTQMAYVVDVMAGRTTNVTGGADAIANMTVLDAIRAKAQIATAT
ncbi:Gfo/Idh/MocA family protein [Sphingobium sp. HWE2-09]|uniref:Gfo/Idh/MocA family protein n=1 Tax=Sphingobium sp. HWE2-09 TaxID=3108390 RepID=UPI002DCC5D14|nr:Gfo/Idh/MocA family oxidoreductase [Sphingobium sp. HWE2-09]